MEDYTFRGIVIGGVILSVIVSRFSKLWGGIIGLGITGYILYYGLEAYSHPGWAISLFNFELSREVFLILIGIWFIFDFKQIYDGIKERALTGKWKQEVVAGLRGGKPIRDILRTLLAGKEMIKPDLARAAQELLDGRSCWDVIDARWDKAGYSTGEAAALCAQAVQLLNSLLEVVSTVAAKEKFPLDEQAKAPFRLPGLEMLESRNVSIGQKLPKGARLIALNGQLLDSGADFEKVAGGLPGDTKSPLDIVVFDAQQLQWQSKTFQVKGSLENWKIAER